MTADDIEQAVFELVEGYNGYWFWLRKRYPLKKETDLNADFRMAPEDAAELLEEYAERFAINPGDIDFGKFFLTDPHEPLTIAMLIESAKAGRWLY
ncbi:DUF1493 family protein [Erwiniaceae bacterium BAC15a-03b]|uniref:DUF1493 family protein n=1 Tax=Winslowiella arboricola TaxID=2978220 RepID=A0A9J6PUE5_9GAMM|nr:DUF1493 family protein [Winslowiella arboricola]MCU5775841.1 DUF1493 family protein [Winslowiella arboricola]MCU5779309.1 DUF1493 family protein [Winslowiella arboricola]